MTFISAIFAVIFLLLSFILAYVMVDAVMSKRRSTSVVAGMFSLFSAFACLACALEVFVPGSLSQLLPIFFF